MSVVSADARLCGGASIGDTCQEFFAVGCQATSHDTSILTCAYNSSDKTVTWKGAARAYILVSSFVKTDKRFDFEVPSTGVMDMSRVSAGTSVSMLVVVPADNSPPILRAETLSPSNGPTTSVSLASLNF